MQKGESGRALIASDYELLKHTPFFSGINEEAVKTLFSEAYVKCFSRNHILFMQGDDADAFYAILDGWVKLFRNSADGQETVIAAFSRGDLFAEAAIFGSKIYPVSASVVEDTKLLVVPAAPFIKRLKENSEMSFKIMGAMSQMLRYLVMQMEQIGSRSAPQRLASFLVGLSTQECGRAIINLPHDKSLIAARLGMQPETLSRAFAKLKPMGVLSKGATIEIRNIEALKEQMEVE